MREIISPDFESTGYDSANSVESPLYQNHRSIGAGSTKLDKRKISCDEDEVVAQRIIETSDARHSEANKFDQAREN